MRDFLKMLLLGLIGAGLGFAGWIILFATQPVPLRESPLDFNIKSGSSLKMASRQLADAGIGVTPWHFTLLARGLGKAADIKAGSYEIHAGVTPLQLLEKLTRGDVSQADITVIEGWTFRQLRAALDAHPAVVHESRGMTDAEVLTRIGAGETTAEGLFFPDTYLFDKNSSDIDILRRAYRAMENLLQQEWARRGADVPYASPYEALIMASIVEKETGIAADRPLVASVFVNRLRAGMPLQTDPTVIYGMREQFEGNLRKRDLQRDSAFNTYRRGGLPPTPIALPGLAALQAALRPAKSEYLYFVARGDGSSEFSTSLEAHNRAVTKYQKRKPAQEP